MDPEYNIGVVCPEMKSHLEFIRENVPEWGANEQRMIDFIKSDIFSTMKSKNTRKTQF